MTVPFTIASNQGTLGGGEVMLLAIGRAAAELGRDVTVVGPETPGELCAEAEQLGFRVVRIPGDSAAAYLRNLRSWDRKYRSGLLWCNGLRPAMATAGRPHRVVHLHQEPVGKLRLAADIARRGSLATIVPSEFMRQKVAGSVVMRNWSDTAPQRIAPTGGAGKTVGYLGRLSSDKGVPVLVEAVERLAADGRDLRLLLAGEARFVDEEDARLVDAAISRLGAAATTPGWMDRDTFFGSVDLAVFPSVWAEPFGLVVTEAMAARCPFVISDAGALPEIAGPGYPWKSSAGDVGSLAATIAGALDGDHDEQLDRSYDRWLTNFSPEAGRHRLGEILATAEAEVLGAAR